MMRVSSRIKHAQRIVKTGQFIMRVQRRVQRMKKMDRDTAEWIRDELKTMGPTYIKIGQFISSRRDIFDPALVEALRGLQDNATPMSREEVSKLIYDRLGRRATRFASIDMEPIACASIGQVHRGVLRDGHSVAIKVRRPDVHEEAAVDIDILLGALHVFDKMGVENVQETRELVEDFRAWFLEEMDFTKELGKARALRTHLHPSFAMPEFCDELCHSDFLIMSYVPCAKFRVAAETLTPKERSALAVQLMDAFVEQLVQHGCIHGDPHEGNVGVAADGRIILYDMGNIITIEAPTRIRLKHMLIDIALGNYDTALETMKATDALFEVRDDERVKLLLAKYAEYMRTLDVRALQGALDGSMKSDLPIKLHATVFRIVRVFAILEGICKMLDPAFSYTSVMTRYMMQILAGGETDYLAHRARTDAVRLSRQLTDILTRSSL